MLRLLNEITAKREKEEPGETEVQENSVDQKNPQLEDENKKLRNLQLEYDLQEVKGKLTAASEALQEEQKEKEQLQRRLRFMSGMLSESENMDQEETSLVVWNEKQEKDGLLLFKPINKVICYMKKRKSRRAEKDRKAFMTDFVKRKSSEPGHVDFLMELYWEGWKIEDLKKISECEQIEEMKQVKENIERARSYQKILNRETK